MRLIKQRLGKRELWESIYLLSKNYNLNRSFMNSLDELDSLLILVICYNKTVAAGNKKDFILS